jgi:hypothetical protein
MMATTLTDRARRYLADAAGAFERAPVEVTAAVALAVAFSYSVETGGESFRAWAELAVAGFLIGVFAWTGTLLDALEGSRPPSMRRWIITGLGAAVTAAYAILVLDFERASEGWRALMLVFAAVLWLLAVPALAGPWPEATRRVRVVGGRVLLRVIGALLYCAALYAGLALALAAINTLFELNLAGDIYAHVSGWIFLVLAPWIIIGGLPDYAAPMAPQGEVAGVVHRMTAFLVPPLLILYYAILYAYSIRIFITGEIPKNLVSPMVLAAGALAGLALFLFDPAPRSGDASAFRSLRAAPPLFLPLAALGVWAIMLRVSQYGWTELRLLRLVVLVVLGALAVAATIQVVRRQRFALHHALLALAAALLLSAVGPWSIMAASRHSQQARLDNALAAVGIDPSAPPSAARAAAVADTTGRAVPGEAYDEVNATARYLVTHFGIGARPGELAPLAAVDDGHDVAARLGLRRTAPATLPDRGLGARFGAGTVVGLDGWRVQRITAAPARPAGRRATAGVVAVQDSMRLRFQVDGEALVADMAALVASLNVDPDGRMAGLREESAALPVTTTAGAPRGHLLVLDIWLQSEGGNVVLQRLDALLLLRRAEDGPGTPVGTR